MLANSLDSGGFIEYMLERPDVAGVWKDFTHHEFVEQMGNGTLPVERFRFYMAQDFLYLVQFARANALAGYKARSLDDTAAVRSSVITLHATANIPVSPRLLSRTFTARRSCTWRSARS